MKTSVLLLLIPLATAWGMESIVPEDPFAWGLFTAADAASFDNEDGTEGEAAWSEASLAAWLPLAESPNLQWFSGAGLTVSRFEFDDSSLDDLDVYSAVLYLDALYLPNDRWEIIVELAPELASDMKDASLSDAELSASALATWKWREGWQLTLGAAYDREFGEDLLYPMGGFIWDASPMWRVAMVLPAPRISCALSRDIVLFTDLQPAGNVWKLEEEPDFEDPELKVEAWRWALGAEMRVWRRVWMHAAVGMETGREYEIRSHQRRLLDSEVDDVTFARLGFVVR